MPNIWTGKGNPYTREEMLDRLRATLDQGEPIIAAGAGTGISAKFIEKGGADLIIVYNSGRFRMAGHGSTAGLMSYGDANAIAMDLVKAYQKFCGTDATVEDGPERPAIDQSPMGHGLPPTFRSIR